MLSMQALAELLKVTHRGYFIPPRPEKNPVEGQRASSDFVELRRHALEKYLVQLASHPAIVQSDVSILHTEPLDFVHYLMALSGAQLCALAQACCLLATVQACCLLATASLFTLKDGFAWSLCGGNPKVQTRNVTTRYNTMSMLQTCD